MKRLAALQDALATLLTDPEVQAVYRRAPGEAIAAIAGNEGRDELGALEPAEIIRHARALRRRRWTVASAMFPLSLRVISGLEERYDAWLSSHPTYAHDSVIPDGADEALRAVVDLAHDLYDDRTQPPWAAELLVYEVLSKCSRIDGVARGLKAQYAIHLVVDELRAGMNATERAIEPHAYAFDGRGVRQKRLE